VKTVWGQSRAGFPPGLAATNLVQLTIAERPGATSSPGHRTLVDQLAHFVVDLGDHPVRHLPARVRAAGLGGEHLGGLRRQAGQRGAQLLAASLTIRCSDTTLQRAESWC